MTHCATPQELERLVNDQLEGVQREAIEAHVQECAACQQVLEHLTSEPVRLGEPTADPSQSDPQTRLLQLLKAQGPLPDAGGSPTDFSEDANDQPRPPRTSIDDRSLRSSPAYPEIAGFRILREIGRGGMGIVYEAEQEVLSRRVALKLLPPHALVQPTQIQRFELEAKAAARLHHTNIVPVFGVGEQDGFHYYVMQYIEGSGLDVVLRELRRRHREMSGATAVAETGPTPARPGPAPFAEPVGNVDHSRDPVDELARSLASGRFGGPVTPGDNDTGAQPEPVPAPAPGAVAESTMGFSRGESRMSPPSADPRTQVSPSSDTWSSTTGFNRPFFQGVARIGLQVAEALDYAHRQGVLHRDIKPSNLLLDLRGNVWITDFGLAKTPDGDALTETGDVVGTIRYLAPERFEGSCDPRSDVYSLGLTLYELASLGPAYDESDRYRLIDRVRREEPPALRTRVPRVPRDLETIVQTAIDREPSRRYARASDLASDLRRFLEGRPIRARRASLPERFARWCRRDPWIAGLSAAVFLSLILGTILSTVQAVRATRAETTAHRQRDRAETEAGISTAVRDFLQQDLLAQASAYNQSTLLNRPDPDLKVRTALDRAAQSIGGRFADRPIVEASIRQTVGDTYVQLGLYREAQPHLQRALDLRRSVLGDEDPDTLLAMKSLGSLYLADQKLTEAEPLLVESMEGLRKTRGSGDPELIDAMAHVARLEFLRGKGAQAERLLTRARRENLAARGEDDPKTLDLTASLGLVYIEQKRPELAEQTLRDVLDRSQRALGVEHPSTLTAKQCLSDACLLAGKEEESIRLLIEVLESQTRVLGRNHPETLASMVKVGVYYGTRNDLDRAEPLLTEALAGSRAALDRNHDTTDGALAGLAQVYIQRKDMKRVGQVLIEAADIARRRWGADSGTTTTANASAGGFLLFQQQYALAEPYLRDGLTSWTRTDPDHRERFFSEIQLGVCLLAEGKYVEARPHLSVGYHGLRPGRDKATPTEPADLGWLIEQVGGLRTQNGERFDQATPICVIRRDPGVQAVVFDLQFPADPFAPP